MAATLSPEIQAFLRQKVLAHLATVMRDGSPQVTPLWVDTDGTHIVVNTSEGRIKVRNMRRDARVALSITDPVNFQKALIVRGRVVSVTTDGAVEHIHEMAKKYRGIDRYPLRTGERGSETRLKVLIEPLRIMARGL